MSQNLSHQVFPADQMQDIKTSSSDSQDPTTNTSPNNLSSPAVTETDEQGAWFRKRRILHQLDSQVRNDHRDWILEPANLEKIGARQPSHRRESSGLTPFAAVAPWCTPEILRSLTLPSQPIDLESSPSLHSPFVVAPPWRLDRSYDSFANFREFTKESPEKRLGHQEYAELSRKYVEESPEQRPESSSMLKFIRKMKLKEKEMRILLLGLDGAGKSSICAALMGDDLDSVSPTMGFEIKTVVKQGFRLNIWDVGGQKTLRPYWSNYYEKTDTMIFIVDATDKDRLEDCKAAFEELVKAERLAGASTLVFNNKCDIAGAMSSEFVSSALDLKSVPGKGHNCTIIDSSAVTGQGLEEGINWLLADGKKRLFLFD